MKVLLLCNKVPYPARDGSSIAMRSTAEALRSNGHEVHILALNTRKHFRAPAAIEKARPAKLKLKAIPVNTSPGPVSALRNLFSGQAYHVSRFWQAPVAETLRQWLKEENYDIVQLEGLNLAVYLPVLKHRGRAKLVLRAHNLEFEIWQRHWPRLRNPLLRAYLALQTRRLERFERWAWQQMDGLVFITARDAEAYRKMTANARPRTAIPSGLEPADYPEPNGRFERDLACLASFDWQPNVEGLRWFVREVWPLLRKDRPQLLFAVGGRHMPASFGQFKRQGISLCGEVEDGQAFVQKARVTIVPLWSGSGMRIKVLENMALGCAQVSTSIGAEGLELRDGVEIRLADTPKDFAAAILQLIDREDERRALAQAARKRALSGFDNRRLGAYYGTFYQSLWSDSGQS